MGAAATAFKTRQEDAARRSAETQAKRQAEHDRKVEKKLLAQERASRLAMSTETLKASSGGALGNLFPGDGGKLLLYGLGAVVVLVLVMKR